MKTRQKNETRYIVTDVASIPVCRIGRKRDAYMMVTDPGSGLVNWYSPDDYRFPVSRDKSDKTQVMLCDEDSSAVLYTRYGEFGISAGEEVHLKDAPKQSETEVIILSDGSGFSIWSKDMTNIKIFVTYDEDGLIDTYRFDNWNGKPYDDDGETEISFSDLQSEDDYENTSRAEIVGTLEYLNKKQEAAQAAEPETVQVVSEPVVETATPSASVTETARPEPAPLVEKRPISAIRAEVCRVANRLRLENAWSRSMSMRESWAMMKSGRTMFPVKGTSFNGRQEALKRLTQYKPQQVHAMLVPEPENEFDRNAVAVKVLVNGAKSLYTVGYIPAADTGKAKALIGHPVQLELIGNDDIRGARIAIAL